MRPRRRRAARVALAATLAALLALTALPPLAAARAAPVLAFSLLNSDGYKVTVTGSGPAVAISVRRPKHRDETVYVTRGRVTATSIHATFPGLGRVAVGFHPAHPGVVAGARCKDVLDGAAGVFRGRIEFHGERGYTSVEAHRAKGHVVHRRGLRGCRGALSHPAAAALIEALLGRSEPQPKTTRVLAEWKQPLGGVFFEAKRVGGDRTEFLAVEQSTRGRLAILHLARARAGAGRLRSDPALSFATVRPPPPFSGSGDLRHGPDGRKVWTGDLSVSFPGTPQLPLTGPTYKTILSRSWGPLPTVPAPLPKWLVAPVLP